MPGEHEQALFNRSLLSRKYLPERQFPKRRQIRRNIQVQYEKGKQQGVGSTFDDDISDRHFCFRYQRHYKQCCYGQQYGNQCVSGEWE